jgi:hypothetical protein
VHSVHKTYGHPDSLRVADYPSFPKFTVQYFFNNLVTMPDIFSGPWLQQHQGLPGQLLGLDGQRGACGKALGSITISALISL